MKRARELVTDIAMTEYKEIIADLEAQILRGVNSFEKYQALVHRREAMIRAKEILEKADEKVQES